MSNSLRPHETQHSKQNEKAEKYSAGKKEHDKYPPNQTKEKEVRSLPEKRIQNNDSEDDPTSLKQNGVTEKQTRDKDWEDERNI